MSVFDQLIPFQSLRLARRDDGADRSTFVTPAYELKEAPDAFGLEIHVPGVARGDVDIQVEQDELVVKARRRWKASDDWNEIFRETADADFQLRLELNEAVDTERIHAELDQGVLRVTLPKHEAVKPRRIEIS